MKYKLAHTENLPSLIIKILSSYITERTAQIKINQYIGPKFAIKSGVPQGGILSPNLFIIYTSDLPPSGPNATDIIFADDITQIIENYRNDRTQLARETEQEIKRINEFEKIWKISTNLTKFNLISISKSKPEPVTIDGRNIVFKNEIKTLGLTLGRTGIIKHITNRINLAKAQTNKLKRFIRMRSKIKLHLYKALIRPILEYPVIPIALASDTQIRKIQKIQNKNLRIIRKYDDQLEEKTIEELHNQLNIEPLNIRLNNRLERIWEKFSTKEEYIYEKSMRENNNPFKDHNWWKRSAQKIEEITNTNIQPIYT